MSSSQLGLTFLSNAPLFRLLNLGVVGRLCLLVTGLSALDAFELILVYSVMLERTLTSRGVVALVALGLILVAVREAVDLDRPNFRE